MSEQINETPPEKLTTKIFPRPNGPLIITGQLLEIVDEAGNVIKTAERFSICRCGHSGTQPICDGSHNRMGFKG
jgi:CDGSH-type Zn-finger protein